MSSGHSARDPALKWPTDAASSERWRSLRVPMRPPFARVLSELHSGLHRGMEAVPHCAMILAVGAQRAARPIRHRRGPPAGGSECHCERMRSNASRPPRPALLATYRTLIAEVYQRRLREQRMISFVLTRT